MKVGSYLFIYLGEGGGGEMTMQLPYSMTLFLDTTVYGSTSSEESDTGSICTKKNVLVINIEFFFLIK